MSEKKPVVYILASKRNGTLYTGVTSNLSRRVSEHRNDTVEGFTKNTAYILWCISSFMPTCARQLLKRNRFEKWERPWKLRLIEKDNPGWRDLAEALW